MKKQDIEKLRANLPKNPQILARERFFNSAVLLPFVLKDAEYHLLFQKRANHIRQGGEICFPGGEHDPQNDKSYQDTAIRETIEELGIERQQINIIGRLDTFLAPHGVAIDPFVGILDIDDPNRLAIDANEVERVFTLPVSHFTNVKPDEYQIRVELQPSYVDIHGKKKILLPAEELGLPERYWKPWGGRDYKILVYQTPEDTIWGITAWLIYDLVQKLQF